MSTQVPVAVPLEVSTSLPSELAAGSTPRPASVQVYETVTSVLFQPLAFAAGVAVAVTVGGVVSVTGGGEPISFPSNERNAPWTPVALRVETVERPAVL